MLDAMQSTTISERHFTISFRKLKLRQSFRHRGGILSAILEKTKTGQISDGKIFVTRLADVIRVRTEKRAKRLFDEDSSWTQIKSDKRG